MKTSTLESGLNSLFLRILLKISVSSSCLLLSSALDCLETTWETLEAEAEAEAEGPGVVAAAAAPATAEESCPGRGASAEGSSTCSISHSIACVTDILQEEKGKEMSSA